MRSKIIAALGAFMLSAGAMQAQTGTTTQTPIDINTASRTQLADAGWGQYADAIIAGRPYKNMNDLVEKKVVPPTAYDKSSNRFVIGNGDTPMSDPNSSNLNPPAVTPPTVTPPTQTPGTTPPVAPGTVPPTVTPPTQTPGAAPTMTPATPPTVTPGAPVAPSPAPTAPAAPAK